MNPTSSPLTEASLRDAAMTVLETANARELIIVRRDMSIAAHVLARGERPLIAFAPRTLRGTKDFDWIDRIKLMIESVGTDHFAHRQLGDGAILLVRFDDRTSLGVVRLVIERHASALVRALESEWPSVPASRGGGPTGAPANVAVFAPHPSDRRKLN